MSVAIDLDLSTGPRGVDGLRSLVRAVVAADPHDELDWIEWKSDLDLSQKAGCFHVARAILGLSNRPVENAARTMGGFGYVIVGAEPGALHGISTVDPADWITIAEKYLNAERSPAWVPTVVPVDEVSVLVVTVDPPRNGDPIWTLRQEFDKYRKGAVFVRKPGRTDPGSDLDLDALQQRLLAGATVLPEITVEIRGESPLAWLNRAALDDDLDAWISTQTTPVRAAADAEQRRRSAPPPRSKSFTTSSEPLDLLGLAASAEDQARILASLSSAINASGFGSTPDERSYDEFIGEVDGWADRLDNAAREDLLRRHFSAGHGLAYIYVLNPTDKYLHDVQVKIHIPMKRAKGFDEIPRGRALPGAPRPFGAPKRLDFGHGFLAGDIARLHSPVMSPYVPSISRTTIENGSIKATFDVGDLRPFEEDSGEEFFILLPERPEGGVLLGTWTATVGGRDGRIEGELQIPVEDHAVSIAALLSREPDADDEDDD